MTASDCYLLGMETCVLCRKNETSLKCGLCHSATCKYCAHVMDPESFSFFKKNSEVLSHSVYCPTCFNAHVAEPLENYDRLLERAKNIDVFFKTQGKETRLVKRTVKPIVIEECFDRDELILRLAFFAAEAGFNAVVDIDLASEKVGAGGSYKKLKWRGVGTPANISERTKVHDKSIWHNPN
jgi:hypothetical protein